MSGHRRKALRAIFRAIPYGRRLKPQADGGFNRIFVCESEWRKFKREWKQGGERRLAVTAGSHALALRRAA